MRGRRSFWGSKIMKLETNDNQLIDDLVSELSTICRNHKITTDRVESQTLSVVVQRIIDSSD